MDLEIYEFHTHHYTLLGSKHGLCEAAAKLSMSHLAQVILVLVLDTHYSLVMPLKTLFMTFVPWLEISM